MRKVSICRKKDKFTVKVVADGHKYQYEYDSLPDAQARARRLCEFLDIQPGK